MPFNPHPRHPGRPIACLGIDPSAADLAAWGLPDAPEGALAFGRALLAAAGGACPVVKPQVAYFERFGAAGYAVLETLIGEAREAGLTVIADAKRADIGPTMDAYAQAWIGPDAPLQVDAVTAVPYLGLDALRPLLDRAFAAGAYVFVVTRSSNPEGAAVQGHGAPPLWQHVAEGIAGMGADYAPGFPGAVIGATDPVDLRRAAQIMPDARFLVPGIGAQGGRMEDLDALPPEVRERLVVSSARAVASQGPSAARLRAAVAALAG
ncbi:MAG: orotidine-5'-phosphate decarboxylase [Pararhodobacter sp.]|nr:orotidine-5'-phosphate decarboxylase [Pararhodobacter sp.]